jgi:hypothetical protein
MDSNEQPIFQCTRRDIKADIQEAVKEQIKDFYGLILEGSKSPRFISRLAACEILGVSEPTLNEQTKLGVFISYRIGGKVMYNYHQLIDAMESKCRVSYQPKIKSSNAKKSA